LAEVYGTVDQAGKAWSNAIPTSRTFDAEASARVSHPQLLLDV
jgi:hypothetical protein